MRNVMSSDQLKEDRMALENLLANLPQNKPGKSSSLEMTPYNTPQLSPATTPANKKNRLPIGKESRQSPCVVSETSIQFVSSFQSSIGAALWLHLQLLCFPCRTLAHLVTWVWWALSLGIEPERWRGWKSRWCNDNKGKNWRWEADLGGKIAWDSVRWKRWHSISGVE